VFTTSSSRSRLIFFFEQLLLVSLHFLSMCMCSCYYYLVKKLEPLFRICKKKAIIWIVLSTDSFYPWIVMNNYESCDHPVTIM
jgi:hypothetical protein